MSALAVADPKRTHALVVAIETYRDQPDLPGPVPDALKFRQWLLSRDVEESNITLLLSPTASNRPLVEPLGGRVRTATIDNLSDVVLKELPKLHGALLFVFWGGHGVVTTTPAGTIRRLILANFPFNLNLDAFLTLLRRSDDLPVDFPHQHVCFIDACGQDVPADSLTTPLEFPPGNQGRNRDQFVLFAARPGEYARNPDGGGLLSAHLLQVLTATPRTPWPPDVVEVNRRLTERFVDLRGTGEARQVPTYLWCHDLDGNEWSTRPTTPGSIPLRLLEPIVFDNRHEELEKVGKLFKDPQTRVVVVQGIAGVGKSSLARAVIENRPHGAPAVWISCIALDLDRLALEVDRVLGLRGVSHATAGNPEERCRLLLGAIRQETYLVLDNFESLLDDASQYRDAGLRAFFQVAQSFEHRVRILATTRVTPAGLTDRVGGVRILKLRGLSTTKAEELFRSLAGLTEDAAREVTQHKAFAKLQGHPKFIGLLVGALGFLPSNEVMGALLETSDLGPFIATEILGRLSAPSLAVLQAVVVFRRTFPFEALKAVCGNVTTLPEAVGQLVRSSLLDRGVGAGEYFVHPLVGDAVKRAPAEEAAAHAAAASWYLRVPFDAEDATTWDDILYHLRRAAEFGGDAASHERYQKFIHEFGPRLSFAGWGRRLVEEYRSLERLAPCAVARFVARFGLAGNLWALGEFAEAETLYSTIDEELTPFVGRRGIRGLVAIMVITLQKLGDVALETGRLDEARAKAARIRKLLGKRADVLARYRHAELEFAIARKKGEVKAMKRWALALQRLADEENRREPSLGARDRVAEAHFSLALAAMFAGDVDAGAHHLVEQLRIKIEIGKISGVAACLITQGRFASEANPHLAWACLLTARQIQIDIGSAESDPSDADVAELEQRVSLDRATIEGQRQALERLSPKLVPYFQRGLDRRGIAV